VLLVAYIAIPHPNRLCERDGCADEAFITVICTDGEIVEHLCQDHAAEHMRGNAYALAGPDTEASAAQAQVMNELDMFPLDGEDG
jgi:hypothetical protein